MVSLFKRIFPGNAEEKPARDLYQAIVLQAREPVFYENYGVPDTVEGRFDMVLLHCFLVLNRLRSSGKETRRLSQTLFDTFIYDLDQSLRLSGVGDLKVGPKLKVMAESFYGRMRAYDDGLSGSREALESALERNLFATVEHTETAVSATADYVRREAEALAQQPLLDFLEGRVLFGRPPRTL